MSVIVWGTFCNPVPNFGLSFYCQGSAACSVFDSFPAVTCQNQTSKIYCTNGYTCGGANFTNDIYIEFPPNDRNATSYDTITRSAYNFKQKLSIQSSSGSNTARRGLEDEVDNYVGKRATSTSPTSQQVYNGFLNVFGQSSNPSQSLITSLATALFNLVSTGGSPTKATLQSEISNSIFSAVKSVTDAILPLMQICQEENAMVASLGPLNINFFSSVTSSIPQDTFATWLLTMSMGHVITNIAMISDVDVAHSMLGQPPSAICPSSTSKATTSSTAKATSISTHSSSPTTVRVSSSKISISSSTPFSVVLTHSNSKSKLPTRVKSSSTGPSASKTTSSTAYATNSVNSSSSIHSKPTSHTTNTIKSTSKTSSSLQPATKPPTSYTTTSKPSSSSSIRPTFKTLSSSSVKTVTPTAIAFSITSCSTALPLTLTSTGFVLTQAVNSSSTMPALTAALYTKTTGASPQLELDSSGVRYLYDNSTPSELFVTSSNFESLRIFQNGSFIYQAVNCSYGIRGSLSEPWSSATASASATSATHARRFVERGMAIVDPVFEVQVTIVNQCGKPVPSAKPKLQCQADLPPGAISNFFNGAIAPFAPVNADGSGNVYQGTCSFGTGSYILCEAGSFACSSDGQWAVSRAKGESVTRACTALGVAAGAAAGAVTLGLSALAIGVVVGTFCDYAFNKALSEFCDYEYGTSSRPCSIPPVSPIVGLNAIEVPGARSSTTSALAMASQTYGFTGTVTTTVTSIIPTTTPNYVSVSDNCTPYAGGPGTSVYCCSGMCLDGTHIGNPGQCLYWLDLCGDLQGGAPSCSANQVMTYGDPATVNSGDGCCGACCCECQYQRNKWSWNCCDCPTGYIAVDKGACDGPSSQCVGCPDSSQTLLQAADGTYGCSC